MSRNSSGAVPSPVVPPPETSIIRVVGWLAIVFGAIPLLMVVRGDEGHAYLIVGAGIVAAGCVLLAIGRFTRRDGR